MSVTLWINGAEDKALELGPTLAAYRAFGEMQRLVGTFDEWQENYPALSGVLTQCELQDDADPAWLEDVRREAAEALDQLGPYMSPSSQEVLMALKDAR